MTTIYLNMMNVGIRAAKKTVGAAAVTIARRVEGLDVDDNGVVTACKLEEDEAFSLLVGEYEKMMGDVALTIFSKAIGPLIAPQCPQLKSPYKIEVRVIK